MAKNNNNGVTKPHVRTKVNVKTNLEHNKGTLLESFKGQEVEFIEDREGFKRVGIQTAPGKYTSAWFDARDFE